MNRWTVLIAALIACMLVALGCSGGGGGPVLPTTGPAMTESISHAGQVQTHLWGLYDCYIDIENQTVEAIPSREATFAANVVQFIQKPGALVFNIISTPAGTGYVDVIIDVTISHPFPGMAMYNGYDVRGVFMGDQSASLSYSSALKVAVNGTDQYMLNPDGYTRWFNKPEFPTPGLMGYTPGKFATPGYSPSATLNAYKYYADYLGATVNLWSFITGTTKHGVFAAGMTNTRRYELRFPDAKGTKYAYAVVANWIDETTHPANAPECVAANIILTPDIWYEGPDPDQSGGDLILDFSLFSWEAQPNKITVESPLCGPAHLLTPAEMTPTGGTGTYSTYHVEVPTTNVKSTAYSWFFIIAQAGTHDYKCEFTPPGGAPTAFLAGFFRGEIFVSDVRYNQDPECIMEVVTPMPHKGPGCIEFDATGSNDPDGDPLTWHWDFDGDGTYDEDPDDAYTGDVDNPTHCYAADYVGKVWLWLEDDQGGESECSVDVDVTVLFGCDFTSNPGTNWTYAYYQYWSGCSNTTVGWSTQQPFGPSGSGNLRHSVYGGTSWPGGDLQTIVTPPFAVPSGASEVTLRAYMTLQFGGSWIGYLNSNYKIVESSTPGLSPFTSGPSAPLPPGGQYMYPTNAHGGGFPPYGNSCGTGPMVGQPGWNSATAYGTGWPGGPMTTYADVTVPSAFYGKTCKVAFQLHPDWCGYPGNGGFAIDDMQLMTW